MKTILESDYAELLRKKETVLIAFSASWCVPCKEMARLLESMEDAYTDRITFVKMDVEDCPNVSEELGIKSVPTLVVVKDGDPSAFLIGMKRKDQIDSILKDFV